MFGGEGTLYPNPLDKQESSQQEAGSCLRPSQWSGQICRIGSEATSGHSLPWLLKRFEGCFLVNVSHVEWALRRFFAHASSRIEGRYQEKVTNG